MDHRSRTGSSSTPSRPPISNHPSSSPRSSRRLPTAAAAPKLRQVQARWLHSMRPNAATLKWRQREREREVEDVIGRGRAGRPVLKTRSRCSVPGRCLVLGRSDSASTSASPVHVLVARRSSRTSSSNFDEWKRKEKRKENSIVSSPSRNNSINSRRCRRSPTMAPFIPFIERSPVKLGKTQ